MRYEPTGSGSAAGWHLQAGAAALTIKPEADQTRDDPAITRVWRRVLPAAELLRWTVEYRLGGVT